MFPPMMPLVHDLLWLGGLAALAFFALRVTRRFELRPSSLGLAWPGLAWPDLSRPLRREPAAASPWFTTTTRSSGNSAFDAWRDGEIARLEAEHRTLEARLAAFEAFVARLKQAKDRQTFDRFMAEHPLAATATSQEAGTRHAGAEGCPGSDRCETARALA